MAVITRDTRFTDANGITFGQAEKEETVCDICERREPKFCFGGVMVCEMCMTEDLLDTLWNDLSKSEKFEALGGEKYDE